MRLANTFLSFYSGYLVPDRISDTGGFRFGRGLLPLRFRSGGRRRSSGIAPLALPLGRAVMRFQPVEADPPLVNRLADDDARHARSVELFDVVPRTDAAAGG